MSLDFINKKFKEMKLENFEMKRRISLLKKDKKELNKISK